MLSADAKLSILVSFKSAEPAPGAAEAIINHTTIPTLSISITAGRNLIPNKVIAPKTCAKEATTLTTTSRAAHTENNSIETNIKAAKMQQHNIKAKEDRKYCSQKIKGIPINIEHYLARDNTDVAQDVISSLWAICPHTNVVCIDAAVISSTSAIFMRSLMACNGVTLCNSSGTSMGVPDGRFLAIFTVIFSTALVRTSANSSSQLPPSERGQLLAPTTLGTSAICR
uniref:Uncharacterized protein n=1 Tax=Glossina austeni TaxID=7395 RepID=A0A1A9V1D4_GLOAU